MARTIESPGVQISEIDLSLNASLPVGTNILINGFADQGPSQELLNITSIDEYEQIYGVPTNAAERYSYHTIKNLLTTPAKVVFNRLPYGIDGVDSSNGYDDKYTALLYPAYTTGPIVDNIDGLISGSNLSGDGEYLLGKPTQITINESVYNDWKQGTINWSTSSMPMSGEIKDVSDVHKAVLIVVNKIQTSINQDFEGYYIAMSDNKKASNTPTSTDFQFDSIKSINTSKNYDISGTTATSAWDSLASSRLDFALTGDIENIPNSISESIESVPTWDFGAPEYNDGLIISLYKLRRSGYNTAQNSLTFIPQESFIGSLGRERKYTDPTGFQETSFFIENIVNNSSVFLDVMVNPNLADGNWLNPDGTLRKTLKIYDDEILTLPTPTLSSITISVAGAESSLAYSGTGPGGHMIFESQGSIGEVIFDSGITDKWDYNDINGTATTHLSGDGIAPPRTGWPDTIDNDTFSIAYYNPYIDDDGNATWNNTPNAASAFSLGLYQEKVDTLKEIGDIPTKLELGLRLAADWETIPLDIVLDAGLSTIHTTIDDDDYSSKEFIDSKFMDMSSLSDSGSGSESDMALAWRVIFDKFDVFCRDIRKDCMFIADPYRNIFINGKDFKTLDDKKNKNFSQHIYTPLKNLTALANSSYSVIYAQWMKVYDNRSSDYAWIPYSGFQGAIMAKLDSILYPWSAPAGLENGLVVGGLDIALKTTQKQRDLLYRNNLNAVVFFPSDGIVSWGQKTLQKKPSAFDRINVRRLFLTLEKSTRDLMKYFVFQPNSTFTRTRVVNILSPIFDKAKNNEGVYDFLIVCDERNNTPEVIDNNELQVDIYLKPVRTAEYILVNFFATKTAQNFSELL